MIKTILKSLIFFAVGAVILYFVYQNQATAFQLECECKGGCTFDSLFDKIIFDFKQANLFLLALVAFCFMLSVWSRAFRWNLLIQPMGYQPRVVNSFFAIMSGYLLNLALPRAGEISRPALLSRYEKIPIDKLIGTIVVDRVFDVIMLLLMVGLAFLLQFNHLYEFLFENARPSVECVKEMPTQTLIPWKTILIVCLSLGVFALLTLAILWNKIKTTIIYKKIYQLSINFIEGIKTVFKLKHPYWFLFHTFFIWFMFYVMNYLCFLAYPPTSNLGFLAALLVFVFGSFGVLIPSPGGVGTYHIAAMAALVIYNIPNTDAFSFANISFFTVNIFSAVFFGIISYMLIPIYNKNYKPKNLE